jgi:DinB superfamily
MSQQDDTTRQALGYIRHHAAKGLAGLRSLAERTAADCGGCLEGISEAQASVKPGTEWSVKEVLSHMISATSRVVIEPLLDLRAGRVPRPFTPDQTGGEALRSIQELRAEMRRLLAETVALAASLSEETLPRGTWEHPSLGPLNASELLALHRLHVMDHVQQIERIKADPGYSTP